jgi:hypothetical protein
MQKAKVPLLLLCGAPGTGKSSVGWEIYFSLVHERVPVAHVDLDGIGYGPPGHFGSFEMKFQNVAAVWRSYAEAGASAFVVSGLRALRQDVEACAGAVPESVPTVIVLTVSAEEQRQRLVSRTKTLFALERGGASSSQTPEALACVSVRRSVIERHAHDRAPESSALGAASEVSAHAPRATRRRDHMVGRRGTSDGRTGVLRQQLRAASLGCTGRTAATSASLVPSNCAPTASASARLAEGPRIRGLPHGSPFAQAARTQRLIVVIRG